MSYKGTFKPFCKRGHPRTGPTTRQGCLECRAVVYSENWEKNKERILSERKRWREENPVLARDVYVKNRMNCREWQWKKLGVINVDGTPFTRHDYNRVFQIQGGLCRGCERHQSEFDCVLYVDHDHSTGMFRGLLCRSCNTILGNARDSENVLVNLISYLRKAAANGV